MIAAIKATKSKIWQTKVKSDHFINFIVAITNWLTILFIISVTLIAFFHIQFYLRMYQVRKYGHWRVVISFKALIRQFCIN